MGQGKIDSSLLPQEIRKAKIWQEKTKWFATAAGIAAWARAQAQHRVTMLDALRGRRGLTGTKKGCDQDACGAWPEPESVNGVVS